MMESGLAEVFEHPRLNLVKFVMEKAEMACLEAFAFDGREIDDIALERKVVHLCRDGSAGIHEIQIDRTFARRPELS